MNILNVKSKLCEKKFYTLLNPSVYNPTPEKLLNRAKKYQENDKAYAYAYSQNGKNLGIVVFEIENTIATILDIAVKSEQQGKGIGSALIDFIFNQFDINKVIAETDDDAIDFYKKYGFVVADTNVRFDTNRYVVVHTLVH